MVFEHHISQKCTKKLEFYLHFISIGFIIASSISDSDYYFCLIVVAVPKGIVHPNTNKQTFIHRSLVQNLFDFVSTFEHKRRRFEECWTHGLKIFFSTIEV